MADNSKGSISIESPIGRFLLEAFDLVANLSEFVFSAQRAATHFDTKVKVLVEKAVREAALAAGLDPQKELKNTGVALIWDLKVQADVSSN